MQPVDTLILTVWFVGAFVGLLAYTSGVHRGQAIADMVLTHAGAFVSSLPVRASDVDAPTVPDRVWPHYREIDGTWRPAPRLDAHVPVYSYRPISLSELRTIRQNLALPSAQPKRFCLPRPTEAA